MAVPGITAHRPLFAFVRRAAVLYVVLRVLIAAFSAAVVEQGGVPADDPFVVILLAAALAIVDVRRRREGVLWANLGYSPWLLASIAGAIASVGELVQRMVG